MPFVSDYLRFGLQKPPIVFLSVCARACMSSCLPLYARACMSSCLPLYVCACVCEFCISCLFKLLQAVAILTGEFH